MATTQREKKKAQRNQARKIKARRLRYYSRTGKLHSPRGGIFSAFRPIGLGVPDLGLVTAILSGLAVQSRRR